eukprot:scaffold116218_cov54-Phaeocystis_antarctica.AAC.1
MAAVGFALKALTSVTREALVVKIQAEGGEGDAMAFCWLAGRARKDVIDQAAAAAAGGRRRLVGSEQHWQPLRWASDALPLADHPQPIGADPAI